LGEKGGEIGKGVKKSQVETEYYGSRRNLDIR